MFCPFDRVSLGGLFLGCRVDEGSQGVLVVSSRCPSHVLERYVFFLEAVGHLIVLVAATIMATTWCQNVS